MENEMNTYNSPLDILLAMPYAKRTIIQDALCSLWRATDYEELAENAAAELMEIEYRLTARGEEIERLHTELAELRAQVKTLRILVSRSQWVMDETGTRYCWCCGSYRQDGHALKCELDAALEESA
jgi:hypothetical protein